MIKREVFVRDYTSTIQIQFVSTSSNYYPCTLVYGKFIMRYISTLSDNLRYKYTLRQGD